MSARAGTSVGDCAGAADHPVRPDRADRMHMDYTGAAGNPSGARNATGARTAFAAGKRSSST